MGKRNRIKNPSTNDYSFGRIVNLDILKTLKVSTDADIYLFLGFHQEDISGFHKHPRVLMG